MTTNSSDPYYDPYEEPGYDDAAADFDVMSQDAYERALELLRHLDELLLDIDADLSGPYEHRHPRLFRRLRELRESIEEQV